MATKLDCRGRCACRRCALLLPTAVIMSELITKLVSLATGDTESHELIRNHTNWNARNINSNVGPVVMRPLLKYSINRFNLNQIDVFAVLFRIKCRILLMLMYTINNISWSFMPKGVSYTSCGVNRSVSISVRVHNFRSITNNSLLYSFVAPVKILRMFICIG